MQQLTPLNPKEKSRMMANSRSAEQYLARSTYTFWSQYEFFEAEISGF